VRGQATVEYVALLALAAMLLALAAPLAGLAPVGAAVVHTIRLGICLVANDFCSQADARLNGLGPCTVARREQELDGAFALGPLRFGSDVVWSAAADSDGGVEVGLQAGGDAGVGIAGIGIDAPGPLSLHVGGEGTLTLQLRRGAGWSFGSGDEAQAFIDGLPGSALARAPSWVSSTDSLDAALAAGVKLRGVDAAGLQADAKASHAVQVGPGDVAHVFYEAELSGPALHALGAGFAELGTLSWTIEKIYASGVPAGLVLRTAQSSAGGGEVTETVRRIGLGSPLLRNAFARYFEPGPQLPTSSDLWLIDGLGRVERSTYSVSGTAVGVGLDVQAGGEVGVGEHLSVTRQRLIEATATTLGSAQRERFDCLDRMSEQAGR